MVFVNVVVMWFVVRVGSHCNGGNSVFGFTH